MQKFFGDNANKDNNTELKNKIFPLTPKLKRKMIPLIICFFIGILLMSIGSWAGKNSSANNQGANNQSQNKADAKTSADTSQAAVNNEDELSQKLENILSRIEGVGEVNVYISYAEGERSEYAVDASTTTRKVEEKNSDGTTSTTTEVSKSGQTVMGDNQPVLVQEDMPKIQGVLVVAKGAADLSVKAELSQAIQRLLAVPANRIQISPAG